jgi:hypothetical protein
MATRWQGTVPECPVCDKHVFWKKFPATGAFPAVVDIFYRRSYQVPDLVVALGCAAARKDAAVQIAGGRYFMGARYVTADTQRWATDTLLKHLDNPAVVSAVFTYWLYCQDRLGDDTLRSTALVFCLRKGVERHQHDQHLVHTGLSVLLHAPRTADNNTDYMFTVPMLLAALERFPHVDKLVRICLKIFLRLATHADNCVSLAKDALPGALAAVRHLPKTPPRAFVALVGELLHFIAPFPATVAGVQGELLRMLSGVTDDQFMFTLMVACKVLKRGAANPDNNAALVAAVPVLLAAMDKNVPSLAGVKAFAVGVATLAAVSAANAEALVVAVPFLRHATLSPGGFFSNDLPNRYDDCKKVVNAGLRALWALVENMSPASASTSGVAFGALCTAQEVLRLEPRAKSIALRALGCIAAALGVPEVRAAARAVVPFSLGTLPDALKVRVPAVALLCKLLEGGDLPREVTLAVVTQLVDITHNPVFSRARGLRNDDAVHATLKAHLQDEDVVVKCVTYFADLAAQDINQGPFMDLVPTALEALGAHPHSILVARVCVWLCSNLAAADANKEALMAHVPTLRALATPPSRDSVTTMAFAALLRNLVRRAANREALAAEAPVMLAALELPGRPLAVADHCVSFFTQLAQTAETREVVKAALPRLRAALAPSVGTLGLSWDPVDIIQRLVDKK